MDDVSKRDERIKQTTEALEQSRRRFHVLRNQTHLIYAGKFFHTFNFHLRSQI